MNPLPRRTACRVCCLSSRSYSSSSAGIAALRRRPAKHIPEYLAPSPSHLLSTTLNDLLPSTAVSTSPLMQSKPLPQGHHLVYFPLQTAPSKLAPDGADLDHSPGPEEYPVRLWVGGELSFAKGWQDRMVLDGREAQCVESIDKVTEKSGDKVFVDLLRRYGTSKALEDIKETRTLCFMKPQESKQRIVKYPHEPDARFELMPSSLHLFTFSALSFNAHAIHYDPGFAKQDGHRGCLVHGPFSLTMMLRVLCHEMGSSVRTLRYRNYAPLYANESMSACVRRTDSGMDVWVEGPEGGMCVKGNAVFE